MSKRPVTVEDLIRLKCAERPESEFWTRFDRELRAKQLAALVEKRPWWRGLSNAFSGLARYRLPIGATAVLAITFLAVRESEPRASVPSAAVGPETLASTTGPANTFAVRTENPAVRGAVPDATIASIPPEAAVAGSTGELPENPANVPVVHSRHGSLLGTVATVDVGSSNRELDARFSVPVPSASEAMIARNLLGAVRGFETRALPVRPAVEPLQQMMTPRDVRRARMLSAMASMSAESPVPTGERVARNLPDDRLYDQINRFSGRGDRLSVRF